MSLVQYLVCDACEFRFGPVGVKPHQPEAQRQQLFVLCNQCRNPMVIDDIPGQITTPCDVCGACDFSSLNQCPVCASHDVHWRGQDELAVTSSTHAQTTGEHEHERPPVESNVEQETHPRQSETGVEGSRSVGTALTAGPESMSIEYIKLSGCLNLFMGVMTLGVANLCIWLSTRKWPVLADDSGVVLGNGKRIPWERIQRVEHVTTTVNGTTVHRFTFVLDSGTWTLPYERLVTPQPVLDFVMARVPPSAKQSQT